MQKTIKETVEYQWTVVVISNDGTILYFMRRLLNVNT